MLASSQPTPCPTCGEAIPAGSPGGWCPACLLDRLIGEGAPDNPASADTLLHSGALPHGSPPDELRQIGPYQLVEKSAKVDLASCIVRGRKSQSSGRWRSSSSSRAWAAARCWPALRPSAGRWLSWSIPISPQCWTQARRKTGSPLCDGTGARLAYHHLLRH